MKRLSAYLLTLIITLSVAFPFVTAASAAQNSAVSPALEIIAGNIELVKTGVCGNEIKFSAEDFSSALGVKRVSSVTVLSIPDVTSGKLMLGNSEISKNTTISGKDLSKLRFVPSTKLPVYTDFRFRINDVNGYDMKCSVYTTEKINYAPTAASVNGSVLTTLRNITAYGVMNAIDPENDELTFVIVKNPSKGLLTMTDRHFGNYSYTPILNYTGKDSFEYIVYDKYGNASGRVKVNIRVEKPPVDAVFDDMIGHWAHNEAIRCSAAGIMNGTVSGDKMLFNPSGYVSRAEFLKMAMICAECEPSEKETVFTDDAEIPAAYKGYVSAAYELGVIKGIPDGNGIKFNPNGLITRSEAAVMLNGLLGLAAPAIKPVFSDADLIPAWAESAFSALNEAGIFNGTGSGNISPNSYINRAQAARIFVLTSDYKTKN